MENQLLEQICENMTAEIPECMFTKRQDEMVQDYDYRLRSQGLDLDTYLKYLGQDKESFKETFKDGAEKQVKVSVALRAIITAENIEASEDEINAEAEKIGSQYGMDAEQVKRFFPRISLQRMLSATRPLILLLAAPLLSNQYF